MSFYEKPGFSNLKNLTLFFKAAKLLQILTIFWNSLYFHLYFAEQIFIFTPAKYCAIC